MKKNRRKWPMKAHDDRLKFVISICYSKCYGERPVIVLGCRSQNPFSTNASLEKGDGKNVALGRVARIRKAMVHGEIPMWPA